MSTALADLEKAFQVQLLVRHHARGISLTPAGRELLVASRQLLAQAADLLGAAEGLGNSLTGTVQIGCFSVPAPYVLPELLAAAAEQFPGLQVETAEVNLAELAEGVASGRFELGIGYDLIDDDRLTQQSLYSLPPYVLLPGTTGGPSAARCGWPRWPKSRWSCLTCRTAATTSSGSSAAPGSPPPCATARPAWRPAARWWAAAWLTRC